ncbi:unnamed protein product [Mytilus edulis]|uniref:Uncharacterized protein n=1 Tax=Mytilus edulis TaxID=6550 RepID=A0A8S3QMW4_MYTED|nr:unnamed protein product [Mytilus edulis]
MDLNKLKSIRKANRSVVTRHLRKIDDLKNEAELARVDLLATFESVEQKKKLLEDLNQQIISAIDTEDIEKEILNTDEYTLDLETKLKHLRLFIQSLDNSNNHTNQQSTSSYQTLNYEAPPFIPTSCIENQQQSFIAPSLSTPSFTGVTSTTTTQSNTTIKPTQSWCSNGCTWFILTLVGVVVILICLICLCCYKKRSKDRGRRHDKDENVTFSSKTAEKQKRVLIS